MGGYFGKSCQITAHRGVTNNSDNNNVTKYVNSFKPNYSTWTVVRKAQVALPPLKFFISK